MSKGPSCRVLVIGPSPALLGGISSLARTLVEQLRAEPSIEVDFLPIDPRLPGVLARLQSIKFVRTAITSAIYGSLLFLRVIRCDVVHLYSASYTSFLIASAPAILVARLFRRPLILNYHSGNAEGHLRSSPAARWIMRLADEIVVSSKFLADVFAEFGFEARVLPSPIDLRAFTYRERVKVRPLFFTSRLLEPIYNVECVLRAFALIQEEYPDARLVVAGEGHQRVFLEAFASEKRLRVEFVGRVPAEEVADYCMRSDVYLSATDVDNVPSSIIEAMAAGMPVVTTDAGGIPYLFVHDRACLMVHKGDAAAMAQQSLRLLADGRLGRRIARNAWKRCRQFEWSTVRQVWLDLYADVSQQVARQPVPVPQHSTASTTVTRPPHCEPS